MYGNEKLPGVSVSESYRNEGSIWRGSPAATWFKVVAVNGESETASPISQGTIMKQVEADGSYTPLTESDITGATSTLLLGIVADSTAETGTTTTTGEGDDETTTAKSSSVLIGVHGEVDESRLYLGEKLIEELTDEQQLKIKAQLAASGFHLVKVEQA